MRILYHHRTLGSGAEGIHIREMVKAFRSLGHTVQVIGPVGEKVGTVKNANGPLSQIKGKLPGSVFEVAEMGYNLYNFITVCNAIRSFKPDFIYDRYSTFNAACVLAGQCYDLPVILEVNAPLALERSTQADETLYFRRTAFESERWICSNASKTIVVSSSLSDYLMSIGVPADKLIVMPNGADPEQFYPRPKVLHLLNLIGAKGTDIIIGFTGVLRPWHGLELLLQSFSRIIELHPSAFLLLIGDGPIRNEIEQMAMSIGIRNHFYITGFIDHENVPDYVNLMDIAVSPRSTFYASPMKVIEYMAAGKAVVVPCLANFLDFVDPWENGAVFEDNDMGSLASTLSELCSMEELREQLGRNARYKVESRLNWKWNAREVCRLSAT